MKYFGEDMGCSYYIMLIFFIITIMIIVVEQKLKTGYVSPSLNKWKNEIKSKSKKNIKSQEKRNKRKKDKENKNKAKKYEPFFIINRLVGIYIGIGFFILSLLITINIFKYKSGTNMTLALNILQIISMVMMVASFFYVILSVRETGTKKEDSKHIANLLNKSIIPIVTLILIFSSDFITESYSFTNAENTFRTDVSAVYLKIVPVMIIIFYNIKIFWFEISDEKEKDELKKNV